MHSLQCHCPYDFYEINNIFLYYFHFLLFAIKSLSTWVVLSFKLFMTKSKRLTDLENKLMVAKREGWDRERDWD